MTSGHLPHRLPSSKGHQFAIVPTTRLGKWAVGLAVASVLFNFTWRLMGPLGGFPSLAFGLAGGIVGLVAIFQRSERAVSVFVALVPFVGVIVFLLAEFLIGHN